MTQMFIRCLLSALLGLLVAGCPAPQARSDLRPDLSDGPQGNPETPDNARGTGSDRDSAAEPQVDDYWLRRYESFFAEEQRARYLATAPEARFDEYGHLLLDLQARAELLDAAKHLLSREEIALYYQLPDYRACITFVRARASRQKRGPNEVATQNAASAKKPEQESQRSP